MIRVVIDTSTLVSFALTTGDIMSQVIRAWRAQDFEILTSPKTLAELENVLQRPHIKKMARVPIERLYVEVYKFSQRLSGQLVIEAVCRDPEDDMFLACAVEGNAHYLISSDKDLLTLGRYKDICILNPGQFLVALQLSKLSKHEIQVRYSQETLQQIQDELCLDPETKSKLAQLA